VIGSITSLARVLAQKCRSQNKVIQLVHNVNLVWIRVSLNHKAVTRFVIDRITDFIKLNSDFVSVSANHICKYICNCDRLRIRLNNTILARSKCTSWGSHRANRCCSLGQTDLLRIRHLNTACVGNCVVRSEPYNVVSQFLSLKRPLLNLLKFSQICRFFVSYRRFLSVAWDYESLSITEMNIWKWCTRLRAAWILYVWNWPTESSWVLLKLKEGDGDRLTRNLALHFYHITAGLAIHSSWICWCSNLNRKIHSEFITNNYWNQSLHSKSVSV
jgi:hypothetical protein